MNEIANGEIQRIGRLISTQDNRATSEPLFIVQQKRRIWGIDGNYCCDGYEWVDEDDHEVVAEGLQRAELDLIESSGDSVDGWYKVYYIDQWAFVTACFTEEGCKDYIASNGHNLTEPRIYAASAYRNREMIAIRGLLKSFATE